MKDILQQADEIPVTLLVALAYITMAFLTNPVSPTAEQMHQHGWLMATLVSDGEPWRLFSSAFLHMNWLHLLFNTYALLAFGPGLERSLGSVRLAALYLISALGGSLAVCIYNSPFQPVLGGSGALFGMWGAVLALQMRQTRTALGFLDHDGPRRTLRMIMIYLVVGAFVPFISNTGHVGGAISGFAFAFLFLTDKKKTDTWLLRWRIVFVALMTTFTLHTLHPSTRYDWLWRQARATEDRVTREQLQLAAARAFRGTNEISAYDVQHCGSQMDSYDREIKQLNER